MDIAALKKFAQGARRSLLEQISVKLSRVLEPNSLARRESPKAVAELEDAIKRRNREQVVERVAYTWFNRFCALRFMDVNHYSRVGVVSPAPDQFQPEILAEAKMGHIDEELIPNAATRERVFGLLRGTITSPDPQGEAYALLLTAICDYWHQTMPFLFERIHAYAELLLPDDLLSERSVLAQMRNAMTEENCADVEVIGWLYQFYISEKKDEVFEGLKRNRKITPENIPAATQLFTPDWIVRYLVENSLGRLWMLNRPSSALANKMVYYIRPEHAETDFLRVKSPEEIKICDPACGSGHMLTYAFDLLFAIYEEEGYSASEIPTKILTHNLYGVEIDERAGALAAFALCMKARARQRAFFRKPVRPHICVLQNVEFADKELADYMDAIGRDLFTAPLLTALRQFEEADNFGSLIMPEITNVATIRNILEKKDVFRNLMLEPTHKKVLRVLRQSEYLGARYHVVITNPPYMGGKGMNTRLGAWAKNHYPESKSDLFAMFMERSIGLTRKNGIIAMITMQSWMFLSSFEAFRSRLLQEKTLLSMTHFGARAFESVAGEVVATTAFVIFNVNHPEYEGEYIRLVDHKSEKEKACALREAIKNPDCGWFFLASADDFKKIPGSPIAYWVSKKISQVFQNNKSIKAFCPGSFGMSTGDQSVIKRWFEINFNHILFQAKKSSQYNDETPYAPYDKGGEYRKWYGNKNFVIDWRNDGETIRNNQNSAVRNSRFFCKPHISWTLVTSSLFSCRRFENGYLLDTASNAIYDSRTIDPYIILGLLNSSFMKYISVIINPTLNFSCGVIDNVPVPNNLESICTSIPNTKACVTIAKTDWGSYETSWDFTALPLLCSDCRRNTLADTYEALRAYWRGITLEMRSLEGENNRLFIDAYDLQDELTSAVPLDEITLTCNPYYRYGDKPKEELEALLLADTMKEFISYAVGCMFGRYSLEKPGLVLANQGETYEDYLEQVPDPAFPADKDNVIPLLDDDWFTDDITGRFREFLRLTFGEEHYEENLAFIEKAIGKDIRKYFIKDFYNDHVKRYKKRPIYWLFSSPKGSFNALIYMHRYTPDTVGIVLNDYLREFQTKLAAEKTLQESIVASSSSSSAEKTKATKKLETIRKTTKELEDYERDTLYPLASRRIAIDLDDGVKTNYPKFGSALKKIPGLDAREE